MGNSQAKRYLHGALKYMADEAVKLDHPFDVAEWTLHLSHPETPQQQNSYDCGAFVVMFADYLSDNLPLEFCQTHLPLFRRKICANILRTELKYPIY
jgi:Ulp1 family protease